MDLLFGSAQGSRYTSSLGLQSRHRDPAVAEAAAEAETAVAGRYGMLWYIIVWFILWYIKSWYG